MNTAELQALGSELRAIRERRDLTLPEIEQAIKVRAKFIEAIEQGNAAALPSPVQARGFLRSYARHLHLDPDEWVARWEDALSGGRRRGVRRAPQSLPSDPRRTSQNMPVYSPMVEAVPKRRSFVGMMLFLLILGVISSAIIIGAGLASSSEGNGSTLSAILSPVPTELPTQTDQTTTPTLSPSPTPLPNPNLAAAEAAASGEIAIQITITARTWLRVTVDNAVVFEGMPAPQTVLQYRGAQIGLRAGNAAGVRVVINGADLGILGARGQIVEQVYPQPTAAPPSAP